MQPVRNSTVVTSAAQSMHFLRSGIGTLSTQYISVKHMPPQMSMVQCVQPRQSISMAP